MNTHAHQSIAKAVFETLEQRECMSAATIGLQDGVLTLKADPNVASTLKVELSADHTTVTATATDQTQTFRFNQIKSLVLVGSTQDDSIYVDPHLGLSAQIQGNGGNDMIWGGTGLDTIDGGSGNDQIHGHGAISTGSGNDTVWGSNLGDSIYAGSGNDLVIAGNGNNVIYGGTGNDTLIAGAGRDNITAGSGTTVIYGSVGPDTLVGGTGNDTIYGGTGQNIIVKSATTTVHAQPANDVRIANQATSTGKHKPASSHKPVGSKAPVVTPTPSPAPVQGPSPVPSPAPVPPAVANPNAPTPVITQLETTILAGEGVNVNAISSVIKIGTPITTTYNWDFGDAGSKYNDLTGFNAGHVYTQAGTYTITLTMTDSAGNVSAATSTVTVNADNRPIIYVDTNGSDSNSGLSPAQAVQSATEAFKLAGSNTKIEFMRGETFVLGYTQFISGHDIYIGAYGTGANPVIMGNTFDTIASFYINPGSSNITIQGLTFDSPFGVTSGAAPQINVDAIWAQGTNIVIQDNTFLNVDDAVDGSLQPTGIIVQDNTAPLLKGLREYFCWVDGTNWAIMGNYVANSTRQHVIRGQDATLQGVLLYDNNLTKTYPADDTGEDYKTTINFRIGSYITVSNNTVNDSPMAFGPTLGQSTTLNVDWVVVQDNVIHDTYLAMDSIVHHMLVQGNLFDLSDQAHAQIELSPGNLSDPNGHLTDITITQNTGLNAGTVGQFLSMGSQAAPGSITLTNNLYEAPTDQIGWNDDAALWINAPDLSGFAQISGNIWPATVTNGQGVAGIMNFVAGSPTYMNYLSPAQWNALSNVNDDQFASAATPARVYQMTLNGVTAGAPGLALAA